MKYHQLILFGFQRIMRALIFQPIYCVFPRINFAITILLLMITFQVQIKVLSLLAASPAFSTYVKYASLLSPCRLDIICDLELELDISRKMLDKNIYL